MEARHRRQNEEVEDCSEEAQLRASAETSSSCAADAPAADAADVADAASRSRRRSSDESGWKGEGKEVRYGAKGCKG